MFKKAKIKTHTDKDGNVILTVAAGADGEPGKDGKDGKDGLPGPKGDTPDIGEIVQEVLNKIELPKDGKDGAPGKDGKSPDVEKIIEKVLALIPKPKDGVDGKDGSPGAAGSPGLPGKDGADGKDGLPGKDGTNGKDGTDGKDGLPGVPGKDGADGKDSPLSEVLNAVGKKISVLGTKEQVLFEQLIPDGFAVITVCTVAKVADGSGNYASETRYFFNCVNGNLSKVDEKPIYNTVTTNSVLKSTVTTKGNILTILGNGVETSETTWKIDLIIK